MSESGDYTPAPYWRDTHSSFSNARQSYTGRANRSYTNTVTRKKAAKKAKDSPKVAKTVPAKKSPKELVPAQLVCQTASGLIFVIDITASMDVWPGVIFSKLPYLEHEMKVYYDDDVSLSLCACGDAFSDDYPVQIYKEFAEGAEIAKAFDWIEHERHGGMGYQETYDLPALYYLNNVTFPKRVRKPTLIYIADEAWYPFTNRGHAKDWANYNFEPNERVNPKVLSEKLADKFSIYAVLKPYTNSKKSEENKELTQRIGDQWRSLFGADRVAQLEVPERIVDVAFGIMAQETGKVDYFIDELKQRQLPDKDGQKKVDIVLNALHPIHNSGSSAPPLQPDDADMQTICLRDPEDVPERSNVTMDFH